MAPSCLALSMVSLSSSRWEPISAMGRPFHRRRLITSYSLPGILARRRRCERLADVLDWRPIPPRGSWLTPAHERRSSGDKEGRHRLFDGAALESRSPYLSRTLAA